MAYYVNNEIETVGYHYRHKNQKARAKDKVYQLTDGNGLFFEVAPNGKKRWRYRYRIDGKENLFALGDHCPSPSGETEKQSKERINARRFTLAEARIERERCRGLVKQRYYRVTILDGLLANATMMVQSNIPASSKNGCKSVFIYMVT